MALAVVNRHETAESLARSFPGYRVYVLAVGQERDLPALFSAVDATLPTDPSLGAGNRWDALSDSLFDGLLAAGDPRVVIYWDDAGEFKSVRPDEYEIATEVLADLSESLSDPRVTAGATVQVEVLLRLDLPGRSP